LSLSDGDYDSHKTIPHVCEACSQPSPIWAEGCIILITSPASIACVVSRSAYAETNPHLRTIMAMSWRTCP